MRFGVQFVPAPRTQKHRARGAYIRIGDDGAGDQGRSTAIWLTPAEATEIMKQLKAAIGKAEAARSVSPEPPEANAAALPAA